MIYCPQPGSPNNLLEITDPGDTRTVPAWTDLADWSTELAAVIASSTTTQTVLTDLLRTGVVTGTSSTSPRGMVRFVARLEPSAAQWTSYQQAQLAWEASLGPEHLWRDDRAPPGLAADRTAAPARRSLGPHGSHGQRRHPVLRLGHALLPDAPGEHVMRQNRRRGVAVLLVLLMVIVAMALSYAVMREQYTATTLQSNSGLGMSARQAALAGMSVALANMQSSSWAGVGSSLNQSLGTNAQFQVTFTTGDSSLTAGQANYSDYPYRVTVVSVGTVTDPGNSSRTSSYTIQAVVHLVPRAVAAEPANWTTMCGYTLYQWTSGTFAVNVPYRIQGPVRVQQQLQLALASSSSPWYGWKSKARTRYLGDLYAMFTPGSSDFRPFNGPISLPYSSQASGDVSLLNTTMGIPMSNVAQQNLADWMSNTSVTSYQLYPGGKVYSVPVVAQSLQNTTLAPDPIANPAGIFYCPGALSLYNNVSIQGTRHHPGKQLRGPVHLRHQRPLAALSAAGAAGLDRGGPTAGGRAGRQPHPRGGADASIGGLISAGSDLDVLTDTQNGASTWTVTASQNGTALPAYLQSQLTTFSRYRDQPHDPGGLREDQRRRRPYLQQRGHRPDGRGLHADLPGPGLCQERQRQRPQRVVPGVQLVVQPLQALYVAAWQPQPGHILSGLAATNAGLAAGAAVWPLARPAGSLLPLVESAKYDLRGGPQRRRSALGPAELDRTLARIIHGPSAPAHSA